MPESLVSPLLTGVGVSPGRVSGPLLPLGRPPELPAPRHVTDQANEIASLRRALETVEADLRSRAERATTPTAAEILRAEAELAADPVLPESAEERIRAGQDAPHALHATLAEYRATFTAAGGLLAERVTDLDDIGHRTLAALLDVPMPGVPQPGHPYILVADDLSPADTAALDPASVTAIVTERGGPTSHTAILARALGIPAIVGCPGVLAATSGFSGLALVDGSSGELHLGVSAEQAAPLPEPRPAARMDGPCRTADGHPIKLMVNVGSVADLDGLDRDAVAGIGLLRTEFLFLNRSDEPSIDEQAEVYRAVFDSVGTGQVVIRTLDAGADKPLPFLRLAEEPNPALGVRGLRTSRLRPEILDRQLAAIARAASGTRADVRVMAPMVSTPAEAEAFADQVRSKGLPSAGAMVEVPSAALLAAHLLRHVDFLSIGTNDLAQYTMAADRQSGDLPDLLDPWQPAVLRLIGLCAAAGQDIGKPVGVCGEAAADPLLAPLLIGLGVTSLSMTPRALNAVHASLSRHTLADCRRLAEQSLTIPDPRQARAIAQQTSTRS